MKHYELKTKTKTINIKLTDSTQSSSINFPIDYVTWALEVTNKDEVLKQLKASGITTVNFKNKEK